MYRIVGSRGIGKTYHLLDKANRHGGVVVCSNPQAMRAKARSWGFTEIKDFISFSQAENESQESSLFIDDLEKYIKEHFNNDAVLGYTYTNEE